jgi:hypothetical protein
MLHTTKIPLSTLVLFLLLSFNLPAYEKDFPPYSKGKFPPVCEIHLLKPTQENDKNKGDFKSSYSLADQKKKLSLSLRMNYQKGSSGMYARLQDSSGKNLIRTIKIGSHPSNIGSIYWAFLNKDNHKDFIITMDEGDGYLSSGRQQITFLLSTKSGYSTKKIGAYHLEQKDFFDFSTDHKCEYLHQSLVSDGKNNYWSYNILQFINDKIVIKNKLSRYFPKWIKLTPKANDKPARLSANQKKKLAIEYFKQVSASVSHPLQ